MTHKVAARTGGATRDRILNAAILRFARSSYETVGLRDIAADARVDVAYVHRCFGSKERLFAESLEATMEPAKLFAGPAGDIAGFLAKQIFARDGGRGRNTVGPLGIIIRSLSSSEASRVLREFTRDDIIRPLAEKIGQEADTRAAVITALLAGIGILRNVLRIDPLTEVEGGELEKLITQTISDIIAA
ncbi:MAG TPA: TetR family transcriptional regulator [Nitrospira sp.]|jgi:AcrR family transcriptional regulator|nr:TetR family transcriptional regulator [Nitrospira sp.]